ncbi:hypothetical protein GGF37_000975, partial [Kickxella alabastrina]
MKYPYYAISVLYDIIREDRIRFDIQDVSFPAADRVHVSRATKQDVPEDECIDFYIDLCRQYDIHVERRTCFEELYRPTRVSQGSEAELWLTVDGRVLKRFRDENSQSRVLNEYAVIKLLGRPVEYYQEGGKLRGLIMENFSGGTLESRIADTQNHCKWLDQISEQLLHLHSLGVPHGDVCISNVVIDSNDDAVLVDFSNSGPDKYCYCHLQNTPADLVGTDFENSAEVDAYALGILAHELVMGEPMLKGNMDKEDIIRKVRSQEYLIIPETEYKFFILE